MSAKRGEAFDGVGQMQFAEIGDLVLDAAHNDGQATALFEDVDAEAAQFRRGIGEIDFAFLFQVV
jgi:hypothetical protein